jgi:hypothetical protein
MNPPLPRPIRRLKHIGPLQLGKMAAGLYGAMGLLLAPVFLIMSALSANLPADQRGMIALMGVSFSLAAPFLYAAIGFIIGVFGAAIYNLVAKWIGGIEVEVEQPKERGLRRTAVPTVLPETTRHSV